MSLHSMTKRSLAAILFSFVLSACVEEDAPPPELTCQLVCKDHGFVCTADLVCRCDLPEGDPLVIECELGCDN